MAFSLAQFFGLDQAGEKSAAEVHKTVVDGLEKVKPILDNIFNRSTILVHTVLNRFTFKIDIELKPWNPDPEKY